ncbi:HEAT repeat domain-containing protein [Candidatus Micrarchaeota archaeon]|nr:HEAT repeat domain-containing protein [Candidatus Micrarchaeota archaeon]
MYRLAVRPSTTKPQPSYPSTIEALRNGKINKPISALIKMIEKGDPTDRWMACVEIHDLALENPQKAAQALPALLDAFEKWGAGTKCVVAETLIAIGDARVLPTLMRAVNHENAEVRERVHYALSAIPAVSLEVIRQ